MSAASPERRNGLLAALPDAEWRRWLPKLEPVELVPGQVLYEPGVAVSHVVFPSTAIVSLLYLLENGASAEVAVVGNDGLVGIALFMGGQSTPSRAQVVNAGSGHRMPAAALKAEFDHSVAVMRLMLRYTQALITQMSQTAVCNRHHSLDQQLCRLLLLRLDRLDGPDLAMTQEQIAQLLGVRREGVTEAASSLQRAGLLRYARGRIRVLDRTGLEHRTCECYTVVRREYTTAAGTTHAPAARSARLKPPTFGNVGHRTDSGGRYVHDRVTMISLHPAPIAANRAHFALLAADDAVLQAGGSEAPRAGADDHRLLAVEARRRAGDHLRIARLEADLSHLRGRIAAAEAALCTAERGLADARRLADRDALTGLPNRRALDTLTRGFRGETSAASMLAVLFVDLNGFKALNDDLGHAAGDDLLRIVAARLSGAMRRGDFVCRLGGDEFVCVLPALQDAFHATSIARKLQSCIAAPCRVGQREVEVSASIGVALHVGQGADITQLSRRADDAMRVAKAGHRLLGATRDQPR